MKSSLLAAVAMSALLLAAPAAAQGVKIGILNDQSGVYADYGGKWSVEAAKMAVEDFGGKVLGAPIEIVNADHQNKPDIGSNIARQWFDVDGVDVITELTTSSVALAVQRDLEIPDDKLNPIGGAISMGHPIGATGAVLTTKILYELERIQGRYGLVTLCVGGGMGIAGIFERAA